MVAQPALLPVRAQVFRHAARLLTRVVLLLIRAVRRRHAHITTTTRVHAVLTTALLRAATAAAAPASRRAVRAREAVIPEVVRRVRVAAAQEAAGDKGDPVLLPLT